MFALWRRTACKAERSGKLMTMTEMKNKSVNNEQMSASADMQEARMYLRRVRTAHRRADLLCAQAEKYRTLGKKHLIHLNRQQIIKLCIDDSRDTGNPQIPQ